MSWHTRTAVTGSIRYRLALTYAGIALLSVAVLGAVLFGVLSHYFRQSEDRYLRAVAARASGELARAGLTSEGYERGAKILALTSQTRVRIYVADGEQVADSGLPGEIDFDEFAPPRDGPDGRDHRPEGLPSPLGSGLFGDDDATDGPRSQRALRVALQDGFGAPSVTLLLSDGPALGSDVMRAVGQVLVLAALVAMILAAVAGYLLSSRIAHPIIDLTRASDAMAEGDLSARAAVAGGDEVGRLASSFNAMADRIEATVVTLRRFVADAAHEIGTPLTALQADLELAEAAATEDEARQFATRALVQARRIEDLSSNLLRLSRLEAGEITSGDEVVDLTALLRGAVDAAASRADQAGIGLRDAIEDVAALIRGDSAKLEVAFENLVDNALKFTAEGGHVEIGLTARDGQAVAWVTDTGIGIPEAEQQEVFGRFFRARNVSAYPGSGLGLAIVLAIVEGHGGTVGFRSEQSGTRFEVRLPLA